MVFGGERKNSTETDNTNSGSGWDSIKNVPFAGNAEAESIIKKHDEALLRQYEQATELNRKINEVANNPDYLNAGASALSRIKQYQQMQESNKRFQEAYNENLRKQKEANSEAVQAETPVSSATTNANQAETQTPKERQHLEPDVSIQPAKEIIETPTTNSTTKAEHQKQEDLAASVKFREDQRKVNDALARSAEARRQIQEDSFTAQLEKSYEEHLAQEAYENSIFGSPVERDLFLAEQQMREQRQEMEEILRQEAEREQAAKNKSNSSSSFFGLFRRKKK